MVIGSKGVGLLYKVIRGGGGGTVALLSFHNACSLAQFTILTRCSTII